MWLGWDSPRFVRLTSDILDLCINVLLYKLHCMHTTLRLAWEVTEICLLKSNVCSSVILFSL